MIRFSVFPTHLQAVRRRLDTNPMAVHTILNALLHLCTHRLYTHMVAHHPSIPPYSYTHSA
jgi:hypothetical protein